MCGWSAGLFVSYGAHIALASTCGHQSNQMSRIGHLGSVRQISEIIIRSTRLHKELRLLFMIVVFRHAPPST